MDFGRAFTYVFDDSDWFKKIGIVALVSLIPIIGQLVAFGWSLRITRRVIAGDPAPLPELDFGEDLGNGFQAFIIGLVYAIPIFILTMPMAILDSIMMGSNGNDVAGVLFVMVSVCFGILTFIYGILLAFVLPAAYGNFVAKGQLSAGLRFSEVFGLVRKNPGAYLVVVAGTIVSGLIAPLGTIACIIGVVLTYTFAMAVNGHLYGQAYRQVSNPNAPLAAAPAHPVEPPPDIPAGY